MSKQQGNGGNKHETIGLVAPSSKKKFAKMFLANQEIEEKERLRKLKEESGKFSSVSELFQSRKKKR